MARSARPMWTCHLCRRKTRLSREEHAEVKRHIFLDTQEKFLRRGWVRAYQGARMMAKPFPHLLRTGMINETGNTGQYAPRWASVIANQDRMPLYRRRNMIRYAERNPDVLEALFVEMLLGINAERLNPEQVTRWLIDHIRHDLERIVREVNWADFVGFEIPPKKPKPPSRMHFEEACAAEGRKQLKLALGGK